MFLVRKITILNVVVNFKFFLFTFTSPWHPFIFFFNGSTTQLVWHIRCQTYVITYDTIVVLRRFYCFISCSMTCLRFLYFSCKASAKNTSCNWENWLYKRALNPTPASQHTNKMESKLNCISCRKFENKEGRKLTKQQKWFKIDLEEVVKAICIEKTYKCTFESIEKCWAVEFF